MGAIKELQQLDLEILLSGGIPAESIRESYFSEFSPAAFPLDFFTNFKAPDSARFCKIIISGKSGAFGDYSVKITDGAKFNAVLGFQGGVPSDVLILGSTDFFNTLNVEQVTGGTATFNINVIYF